VPPVAGVAAAAVGALETCERRRGGFKKQFIWVIKSKHYLLKFLFQTLQNVKIF